MKRIHLIPFLLAMLPFGFVSNSMTKKAAVEDAVDWFAAVGSARPDEFCIRYPDGMTVLLSFSNPRNSRRTPRPVTSSDECASRSVITVHVESPFPYVLIVKFSEQRGPRAVIWGSGYISLFGFPYNLGDQIYQSEDRGGGG